MNILRQSLNFQAKLTSKAARSVLTLGGLAGGLTFYLHLNYHEIDDKQLVQKIVDNPTYVANFAAHTVFGPQYSNINLAYINTPLAVILTNVIVKHSAHYFVFKSVGTWALITCFFRFFELNLNVKLTNSYVESNNIFPECFLTQYNLALLSLAAHLFLPVWLRVLSIGGLLVYLHDCEQDINCLALIASYRLNRKLLNYI